MSQDTYALINPLILLADKPANEFCREDFLKIIEQKRLEKITFHYVALDGKLKELRLPIVNRSQAERILADGERVDGSSLFKGMVDASLSDLYVVPLYKSAFLNPFDETSLDFICRYMTTDGVLAPFSPDTVLANAASLFKRTTGLELNALGELEFFLVSDTQSRMYASGKQKGYHASGPFVKSGVILDEMVRLISQITGSIKYAHSEVGYIEHVRSDIEEIKEKQAEQMEIEFNPAPVEDAADYLALSRWLIRNVAHRRGCVATFTPKLEEGVAGNGFHIHIEAVKNGINCMTDEKGAISSVAKKIIGGLCTYADSLTAFGNTISSAYLRLVPNQEAPTRICWSDLNRSAMIRVPLGWSKVSDLAKIINPKQQAQVYKTASRQTVELRSPDGSAIIHLLLAGITMAAQWGLAHADSERLADSLYVTGNIFQNSELLNKLPILPRSCVESAGILLQKRKLYEREQIIPHSIIEYVANLLLEENDREMNKKLADLPADDRLFETRKIMHKDLHKH